MEKIELFIQKIKNSFPEQFPRIYESISRAFPITFRTNSSDKVIPSLISQGFKIETGPITDSFIVTQAPANKKLSETLEFENGDLYIQKLSSMLPALALDPKPDEKIIDLCAAPGTKTIQISNLCNNACVLTAVETNRARYFRLKDNLTKYGIKEVTILNEDAALISKKYPQYVGFFDKVLLDAPCSNEGQINLTDANSYKFWNPKLPKKIAKLQKRLLASAISLLKPNGVLVYSTCTFSLEENEEITNWLLAKFKDIKLLEQKRVFPDGKFTAFYYAKFQKQ